MSNIDLRLGDCFEGLRSIPDHSIDCIVTDPPYGNTYCNFDGIINEPAMLKELERIIKPKRAVCIFSEIKAAARLINIAPKFFRYVWVWEKSTATGFLDCNKKPMRAHELILVFGVGLPQYNPQYSKGKPYFKDQTRGNEQYRFSGKRVPTNNDGKRYPRDVIRYNSQGIKPVHPTQKPVDLCEYLVKTYSNPGDTVLDPFMGSGSSGVACVNTGRNFIGCEIDPTYYQIAQKRIEEAQCQLATIS